jgi:hypothetical protein
MSRLLAAIISGVTTLAAQHVPVVRSGPTMQPPAGAYRFGNILFPGGIAPHTQTHAGRIGGVVSGYPPYTGVRGPQFPNRNRTIVVPYAVPVYYGDPYAYAYQQQPNVTVVVPQQPTPSVVINHNYSADTANPVLRDYSTEEPAERGGVRVYEGPGKKPAPEPKQEVRRVPASDRPTIYLIALKDSTIRQAIGYWVEQGTLHYVTPQSTINRITLDNVDRELSHQLNSERNLEFDLNAPR